MGQCCTFLAKDQNKISREFTTIISQNEEKDLEEEEISEISAYTQKSIKNTQNLTNQFKDSTNIEAVSSIKNQNQISEIYQQKEVIQNDNCLEKSSLTQEQIVQMQALENLKKSLTNSQISNNNSIDISQSQNQQQQEEEKLNEMNKQEFTLNAIVIEDENSSKPKKEIKISKQKSDSLRQSLKLSQYGEIKQVIEKLNQFEIEIERQSEIISDQENNKQQKSSEIENKEIDQKKSLKSSFRIKVGQKEKKSVRFSFNKKSSNSKKCK